VLRVAPSAHYAWQRQAPAPEPAWQVAVRQEFKWHSARYGTRRLRVELQAQGYLVGRWLAGAATALICTSDDRFRPPRARRPQPVAGPARAYRPEPGLGG
jgi:hypothetical protein